MDPSANARTRPLRAGQPHLDPLTKTVPAGDDQRPEPLSGTLPTAPPGLQILEELGRGGMGIVYRARQLELNRIVALKMLVAPGPAEPEALARFQAEAQAVAQLHHPGIVQIFAIGTHVGQPYLVLECVEGGTLASNIQGQPQPPREAALLLEQLARAIQHAHEQGIVHRDLKPANVLLEGPRTATPEIQQDTLPSFPALPARWLPRVTDFGLAKRLGSEGWTRSGEALGTPSYMSPEQALGNGAALGPATDIWALGVILYELLTGRPPFRGASPVETLLQVRDLEPVPPSRLQPRTPRDLETITLKCLAKEPGQRYPSAAALAEDLQRYLEGRPIQARPVSAVTRVLKWVRRRPLVAGLLAVLAATIVTSVTVVAWQLALTHREWQRAERNAERETQARQEAERGQRAALRGQADATLERAVSLCHQGDLSGGLLLLVRGLELAQQAQAPDLERSVRLSLGSWEHAYQAMVSSERQGTPLTGVAFHPRGNCVLTASWGHKWGRRGAPAEVRWWKTEGPMNSGPSQPLQEEETRFHPASLRGLVLEPRGNWFAAGGVDGRVRVWDLAAGLEPRLELEHEGVAWHLATDPTGHFLAVGCVRYANNPEGPPRPESGCLHIWDILAGKKVGEPISFAEPITGVGSSPDGHTLHIAAGKTLSSRPWHEPQQPGKAMTFGEPILALAIHPGGELVAVALGDQTIRLHDWVKGERRGATWWQPHPLRTLAFSPDGRLLASGCGAPRHPGQAQLWDVARGLPFGAPMPHTRFVHAVAFAPDGQRLATVEEDGRLRLWRVPAALLPETPLPGLALEALATGPEDLLLLLEKGGRLRLTQLPRQGKASILTNLALAPGQRLLQIALSPDGRVVAAAAQDAGLLLWDAQTGGPLLSGHQGQVRRVAFDPTNRWLCLATNTPETPCVVWLERPTWKHSGPDVRLPPTHLTGHLHFSPNGQQLAVASYENGNFNIAGQVWSCATRQPLTALLQGTAEALAFDGMRLALSSGPQVRTWTLKDRLEPGPWLPEHAQTMVFTSGGLLLTGSQSGWLRLWDPVTGKQIGPGWEHPAGIEGLAQLHGGQTACTFTSTGALRLWRLPVAKAGTAADLRRHYQRLTRRERESE